MADSEDKEVTVAEDGTVKFVRRTADEAEAGENTPLLGDLEEQTQNKGAGEETGLTPLTPDSDDDADGGPADEVAVATDLEYGTPRADLDHDEALKEAYPEVYEVFDPEKQQAEGNMRKFMKSNKMKTLKGAKSVRSMLKKYKKAMKILAKQGLIVLSAAAAIAIITLVTVRGAPKYKNAAVSSESEVCSQIGMDVIKNDGNAVDAAVAVSFCMGVVHPMSTGIGGGGLMMFQNGTALEETSLIGPSVVADYRESAPVGMEDGNYRGADALDKTTGVDSVAVPSVVQGLRAVHSLYGSSAWSTLVQPAHVLAKDGFKVDKILAKSLVDHKATISKTDFLKDIYYPNGVELKEGATLILPKLADTLALIANNPDGWAQTENGGNFYSDLISLGLTKLIVNGEDNYKGVIMRAGIVAETGDGKTQLVVPPPPSQCAVLVPFFKVANLLGAKGMEEVPEAHAKVEAMKFALSQVSRIGDSNIAFSPSMANEIAEIKDPAFAQGFIAQQYNPNNTLSLDKYLDVIPVTPTPEPEARASRGGKATKASSKRAQKVQNAQKGTVGTYGAVIVDKDNNVVALSESIGDPWGSKIYLPNAGFVLNNHMNDFTIDPDPTATNPNSISQFKRPRTPLCPMFIKRGGLVMMGIAASGGEFITTGLMNMVYGILNGKKAPADATNDYRISPDLSDNTLLMEEGGTFGPEAPKAIKDGLVAKGNTINYVPEFSANSITSILMQKRKIYPTNDERKSDGKPVGL